MFEHESRYKLIVVKDNEEYVISRSLTFDEAKEEQEKINAYTKIVKEEE